MNRKFIIIIALLLSGASLYAQEYPQLKELRESAQTGTLHAQMRKEKWGFANAKDNFVIKAVFDRVEEFETVKASFADTVVAAHVWFNGKEGVLSRKGTYILSPVYDEIGRFTSQDIAYFVKDGKKGWADINGHEGASGLDDLAPFDGKDVTWFESDGRWGAITIMGFRTVRPVYDCCPELFLPGKYIVTLDGRKGLLDFKSLEEYVAPAYDSISYWPEPDLIQIADGGLYGCLRQDGSVLFPAEFDGIGYDAEHSLFYVSRDGLLGIYDAEGGMKVDHILTEVPDFSNGPIRMFRDGEMRILFEDGDFPTVNGYLSRLYSDSDRYVDDELVPRCLKPSWYNIQQPSDRYRLWTSDHAAYALSKPLDGGNVRNIHSMENSINGCLGYVSVDTKRAVSQATGGLSSPDVLLKNVVLTLQDGTVLKAGNALELLYPTIDRQRALEYDRIFGTDIVSSWQAVYFEVLSCTPVGDRYLLITNMYVEFNGKYYLVQRWFAMIDEAGKLYSSWGSDGDLHAPRHTIRPYLLDVSLLDDGTIIVTEQHYDSVDDFESDLPPYGDTEVHDRSGRLLASTKGGVPYLFVSNEKYFAMFEWVGDMYEQLVKVFSRVDWSCKDYLVPSKYKVTDDSLPDALMLSDELCAMHYANDPEVPYILLPVDQDITAVPVLKYWYDEWDGQPIHAFGVSVPMFSGYAWNTICGELHEGDGIVVDDVQLEFVNVSADGVVLYSMENKEGVRRFGYFGADCFTQPIYQSASPFVGGEAVVSIAGRERTISKADIRR